MKYVFLLVVFCCRFLFAGAADSTSLTIHFSFSKYHIDNLAAQKLDSFLLSFDTTNNVLIHINLFGHTDQIGSFQFNDKLSYERANAVAEYLVKSGVEKKFINTIQGFGKHQLITTKVSEQERFFNRRVLIKAYYKRKEKVIITPVVEPSNPNIGNVVEPKLKEQKLFEKIRDSSLKVGDQIELPFILFVGGEHIFLQISYPYLDELVAVMIQNPTLEIEIQGHVCCTNEEDGFDFSTGKKNLSVARAKAVYDYLKLNNIDKSRMRFIGFGHQFPITQERTEAEKTRNRRVEIKILSK